MNINFNEKELKAIEALGKMMDLSHERVIIQALRMYQLVVTGHAKLIKTHSPLCKLCEEDIHDKTSNTDTP